MTHSAENGLPDATYPADAPEGCPPGCLCPAHRAENDAGAGDVRMPVYGMCTACGSVEVELCRRTGTRDLSGIGESDRYPTGYGCEVCS